MVNIINVENRVTGELSSETIEGNSTVKIEGPSNINLDVAQGDIASQVRSGSDLVLTLQDGTQIILEDYFVFGAETQLTLAEGAVPPSLGGTSGLLQGGLGLVGAGVLAAASGGDGAPAAPTVALATDTTGTDDGTANDGITYDSTINVTLAADAASWEYTTDGGDNWTAGTGISFELDQGVYADGAVQVRQSDAAGNVSDAGDLGAVEMLAISLDGIMGSDGTTAFTGGLINPVEVLINDETRTFYFWDRNGDGYANQGATHDVLDNLFNNTANTTNADTTRSFTMPDGTTTLRLPTINGDNGHPINVNFSGTEVSSGTENQTTYDGLLAIWDAHNGDGTGTSIDGTPDGWVSSNYWSATSTGAGSHASLHLSFGRSFSKPDTHENYVALEVV